MTASSGRSWGRCTINTQRSSVLRQLTDIREKRRQERRSIDAQITATLVDGSTSIDIKCEVADVSRNGLGIICNRAMPPGSVMTIVTGSRQVRLKSMWSTPFEDRPGKFRCGLSTINAFDNLELIFFRWGRRSEAEKPSLPSLASPTFLNGQQARARRIPIEGMLKVEARTMGTAEAYALRAENVSRSGLLLVIPLEENLPFHEKTIIELTIDPDRAWTNTPIRCLAKIVRHTLSETDIESGIPSPAIGIQVIEMDRIEQQHWTKCLEALEKKTNPT